ncbi:hypothetical protein [Herbidospora sp. RD11066]
MTSAVIVMLMLSAYGRNDVLLSMMECLLEDGADLEPVREAFESTKGDFTAKFAAAIQARLTQLVEPELFIDVPERPADLRKSDLEAIVRPAVGGFLRSQPSKDDLVDQAELIRWRQERRPEWIPRVDRHGEPIPVPRPDPAEIRPERPLTISALAELSDVKVLLPAEDGERPELSMPPGGIGEWEAALYTFLGITGETGPGRVVLIDAQANEALIPEGLGRWLPEQVKALSAAQDTGVASELLATSATLGGLTVTDDVHPHDETLALALESSGDWRFSPRWRLNAWDPSFDVPILATARAAVAGWAGQNQSGLIVYVYGAALNGIEGLTDRPSPLHGYLLCITRAADGTDTVASVHRVILSCPGAGWCHGDGCPETEFPEAAALLASIVSIGEVASLADQVGGPAGEIHERMYGTHGVDHYSDPVMDCLEVVLSGAGWTELERSTWEGGIEELLVRRGAHCLSAAYDPVTRQIRLADGKPQLEGLLDSLAEDGVLIDDHGKEAIDLSEHAVERWGTAVLTVASDHLRGAIDDLPQLADPLQTALLGLHPHADGTVKAPQAGDLVEEQLTMSLRAAGLLGEE